MVRRVGVRVRKGPMEIVTPYMKFQMFGRKDILRSYIAIPFNRYPYRTYHNTGRSSLLLILFAP